MPRTGFILDESHHFATPPGVDGQLVRVAHEIWAPDFRFSGRSADRFTVGLVVAGAVEVVFAGMSSRVSAGHAICWDGRPRRLRPAPGPPPELFLATVADRRLEALARRCLGTTAGGVELGDVRAIRQQFATMLSEAAGDGPLRAEILLARIAELLWRMAAARRDGRGGAGSTAGDRLGECIRLAERGFRELRSTADLAAAAGMSSAHLCRLFRGHRSGSPLRLLTRLRMEAAVEDLGRGLSVAAVAGTLGYRDPFTFSKAFKRHHGVPPSRFG